jgi:hypothetical protein
MTYDRFDYPFYWAKTPTRRLIWRCRKLVLVVLTAALVLGVWGAASAHAAAWCQLGLAIPVPTLAGADDHAMSTTLDPWATIKLED